MMIVEFHYWEEIIFLYLTVYTVVRLCSTDPRLTRLTYSPPPRTWRNIHFLKKCKEGWASFLA